MTTIDIILGLILLVAFYMGYSKGLFVALASLVGLVAGVYGAIHFSYIAGNWLSARYDWSEQTTQWVAFGITFVGIVIIISLAGKFLTKVADFAALGFVNKLLGGIFGVLKYAFLVSVLFMIVHATERYQIVSEEERETSLLYPPIASLAPSILPQFLDETMLDVDPSEEELPAEAKKDSIE
jgi:membrane protein required for colicin V production